MSNLAEQFLKASIYNMKSKRSIFFFLFIVITITAGIILFRYVGRGQDANNQSAEISLEKIKKQGDRYVRRDNPDSALLCYTAVISRYNNRRLIGD